MPIQPGEYADVLRSLGQVLEKERAEEIVITCQGEFLSASWRGQGGSDDRGEIEQQLAVLHEQAKMTRVRAGQYAREGLAEVLRTLGQELDQGCVELLSIAQQGDSWTVTCATPDGQEEQIFLTEELLRKSREQRELRASQAGAEAPAAGLHARTGPISRRILRHDMP